MTLQELLQQASQLKLSSLHKVSGIYLIHCKSNNMVYIGSTFNFLGRSSRHFKDLKANLNRTKHLQNAWNKYGEENFMFMPLELVNPATDESLLERENFYLLGMPREQLFNSDIPAKARRFIKEKLRITRKLSPEHKEKLHQAILKKGTAHLRTPEVMTKIQNSTRGRPKVEGHSFITKELAIKIKEEFDLIKEQNPKKCPNGTLVNLREKYKVGQSTISYITSGKHWAFDDYHHTKRNKRVRRMPLLTKETVLQISSDFKSGLTVKQLLEKYPFGKTTIYSITEGKHPKLST